MRVEGSGLRVEGGGLSVAHRGSRKFTTQNDLYQQFYSKRVIILIETKSIDFKCLQMISRYKFKFSGIKPSCSISLVRTRKDSIGFQRAQVQIKKLKEVI